MVKKIEFLDPIDVPENIRLASQALGDLAHAYSGEYIDPRRIRVYKDQSNSEIYRIQLNGVSGALECMKFVEAAILNYELSGKSRAKVTPIDDNFDIFTFDVDQNNARNYAFYIYTHLRPIKIQHEKMHVKAQREALISDLIHAFSNGSIVVPEVKKAFQNVAPGDLKDNVRLASTVFQGDLLSMELAVFDRDRNHILSPRDKKEIFQAVALHIMDSHDMWPFADNMGVRDEFVDPDVAPE